ncbi:hypothetical protein ACIP5Y_35220 [Nocardia sp. NPDC088792]|uniref:hypothetical protein n=1 Tax=Nocardia sp. NPDC088792 TaxID=3364332 RepID=UPI00382AE33D
MSATFTIRMDGDMPLTVIDTGLSDLRWYGEELTDPVTEGSRRLYRAGLSTRAVTIHYEDDELEINLPVGSCEEDCELALGIVRRAAVHSGSPIETDHGELSLGELDDVFDAGWREHQLTSAIRVAAQLVARDGGVISLPGPNRSLCLGPRLIAQLENAAPAQLVALMRRVQWPDPRYEQAGTFEGTRPESLEKVTFSILLPDRDCIMPYTNRLLLRDNDDNIILIPRKALAGLPVFVTPLDDGNDLVDAIAPIAWEQVCVAARQLQVPL